MKKHMTEKQRFKMMELFQECDTCELLQCVAGLVSHNVEDYKTSQDVADQIRKAAKTLFQAKSNKNAN